MAFLVFFSMIALLVVVASVFVIKHYRNVRFLRQREDERAERIRLETNIRKLEVECGLVKPEPNRLLKKRHLG